MFDLELEPCVTCRQPTPASHVTLQPNRGFLCWDCRANERGCQPEVLRVGTLAVEIGHAPNCPQSPEFDRRRTRTNKARCGLERGAS
jgi:hypothetical protein